MEIFNKPGSKFLWYDFTVRGQRYRGSTKETNEKRADGIAALKFAEACEHSDPLPRRLPTLGRFSARFLEWVESARLKPKTKTYYTDGWGLLSTTAVARMKLDMISNDEAEVLSFPGGGATTNCALRTLRRMLGKAEDWKLIRRAPKIKLVEENSRSIRLTEEYERRLLAGAAQCNWRPRTLERFGAIVVLMRQTGMRNERELFQVCIENIDWDKRTIYVPDSKTVTGIRNVPMSERAYEVLRKLCGSRRHGWLFPSKRTTIGHLTTVAGHFRQARRKAGLPEALVLYCGRHDFGTRLYDRTKNLKLVMAVMGHKDVKSAMRYQLPELELARVALNEGNAAAEQAAK